MIYIVDCLAGKFNLTCDLSDCKNVQEGSGDASLDVMAQLFGIRIPWHSNEQAGEV